MSRLFSGWQILKNWLCLYKNKPVFYAVVALFLLAWHERVTSYLSLSVVGVIVLYVFLCMAYGGVFIQALSGLMKDKGLMVIQFLCGYYIFNTLLFLLALFSPFGMAANIIGLFFGAIVLLAYSTKHRRQFEANSDVIPDLLCFIISGIAATLWCSDSQQPTTLKEGAVIFQTWQDTFVHVREISSFAQSHGIGTIFDIKMSGMPAPIYHFASYMSPAAISVLTGTPAIDVYSSFMLPFGIFLTGLAAFSLASQILGAWPALAATVAIVIFPDAYQQGFGNKYLSYNFLAQVNLGMLYGIACAAIAWVFIINGCLQSKYLSVLVGYCILVVSLFYKAHIFVANSFLILIYPCIFFVGVRVRWRIFSGIIFGGIFIVAIIASQRIGRVPVLRLDGSGIAEYLRILVNDYDPGMLKFFFEGVFFQEKHSKLVNAIYAVAMLMISTFGVWAVVTPLVGVWVRQRVQLPTLYLPFFVICNYLIMSIGLALDTRGIGTPDELLNRPLVWAYFVVAAWTAGIIYYLTFGNNPPKSNATRFMLGILISCGFLYTFFSSQNFQTFPARRGYAHYEEFNSVPLCLVKVSEFIRDHSHSYELVQDSEFDPRFVVTALSERQIFVGKSNFGGFIGKYYDRTASVIELKNMQNVNDVIGYMAQNNISWFLLHPNSVVSWPTSLLENSIYKCDGYRVYRFE